MEEKDSYGVRKTSTVPHGEPVSYINTLNFWKKVEVACRERKSRWKSIDDLALPKVIPQLCGRDSQYKSQQCGEYSPYRECRMNIDVIQNQDEEFSDVDMDSFKDPGGSCDINTENKEQPKMKIESVNIHQVEDTMRVQARQHSFIKTVGMAILITSFLMAGAFYFLWKLVLKVPTAVKQETSCYICEQPRFMNEFVNLIFPASNALDEV